VRSLDQIVFCCGTERVAHERFIKGAIKKQHLDRDKYLRVAIAGIGMQVGRLVLLAFVGWPPDKEHQCCHNDGDRTHNKLSNLRWGTPLVNAQDRDSHGHTQRGQKHYKAKLEPKDIEAIRAARGLIRQVDLAKAFNICQSEVSAIQLKKFWRHV
jgi:hypothetical protein